MKEMPITGITRFSALFRKNVRQKRSSGPRVSGDKKGASVQAEKRRLKPKSVEQLSFLAPKTSLKRCGKMFLDRRCWPPLRAFWSCTNVNSAGGVKEATFKWALCASSYLKDAVCGTGVCRRKTAFLSTSQGQPEMCVLLKRTLIYTCACLLG